MRLLQLSTVAYALAAPSLAHTVGTEEAWRQALDELAPSLGVNGSGSSLREQPTPSVGYFLRSFSVDKPQKVALDSDVGRRLEGITNLRLLPSIFPPGMDYHFDGLATVLSLAVENGTLTFFTKAFESSAAKNYSACLFMGVGTSKSGTTPCFQNPAVNLLPVGDQLWLTVDTAAWGRVDATTLETVPSKAHVNSLVLNAHPACDQTTGECFVQHPCPKIMFPLAKAVCFSRLLPGSGDPSPSGEDGDLRTEVLSHAETPHNKIIQHSHSPCVTPNFLVSKLDAFTPRWQKFSFPAGGILSAVHQSEDNVWLVMDRRTNESRVLASNASFVNNHFWNCYEDAATGEIVVESVAATAHYLDIYYSERLAQSSFEWGGALKQPIRCRIPQQLARGGSTPSPGVAATAPASFACTPLLAKAPGLVFDYPTYNPHFKMNPDYRWMYAIAPRSTATSRWFDQLVKVDIRSGGIDKAWSAPGIYLTEFDFAPAGPGSAPDDEDDGLLLGIVYNQTSDLSSFAVIDAKTLAPLGMYPLGAAVPFHAHGIVCRGEGAVGKRCFSNP